MIDVYFCPTPNGHKIAICLEEAGLRYRFVPVAIDQGKEIGDLSSTNHVSAISDDDPLWGEVPAVVYESSAVLLYLSGKVGCFLPAEPARLCDALQWVFYQTGGVAPQMTEKAPWDDTSEVAHLCAVLDRRLAGREYIADEYSIADMATYPWIHHHAAQGQDLGGFGNIARWFDAMARRPGTISAYQKVKAASECLQPHKQLSLGGGAAAGELRTVNTKQIRRAEEFIQANMGEGIRLTDIARAAGCSVRALQMAFRTFRNTTPMTVLKQARLAKAYSELSEAGPGATTVTEVAVKYGFYNIGRFAQEYKRAFGQSPSETLWMGPASEARAL